MKKNNIFRYLAPILGISLAFMVGMLFNAIVEHDLDLERSYMVGDWWSDIGAGQAAGIPSILVRGSTWNGIPAEAKLEEHELIPDTEVDSLGEAVDWILEDLKKDMKG